MEAALTDAPPQAAARRGRTGQIRSATTRAALVAAARRLFGSNGYHDTGTNDVVALAGVTRGALYHHFRDKQHLFEAVYRQVSVELSQAAREATLALIGQTWIRTFAWLRVYLDLIAGDRPLQQILLVDGPAVFGWKRWRELQGEYRLPGWLETFRLLIEQGEMASMPIEPLAHLIIAALDDAALAIAHAADPARARQDTGAALEVLLGGLRRRPDG